MSLYNLCVQILYDFQSLIQQLHFKKKNQLCLATIYFPDISLFNGLVNQ